MNGSIGSRALAFLVLSVGVSGASACASAGALARPALFPAPTIVSSALMLRGTPYRYGGSTPASGFDCSGFVAYVMAQHAIALPRSVAEQFAVGAPVGWDRLRHGDLIFFSTIGPGATHVGIVSDEVYAEFVHAPSDGASVRSERFDTNYWRSRFVGARRVF